MRQKLINIILICIDLDFIVCFWFPRLLRIESWTEYTSAMDLRLIVGNRTRRDAKMNLYVNDQNHQYYKIKLNESKINIWNS